VSEEVKSESEKKKEDWMNAKWRPMMGWMYMFVCMCDFVVFPILWSLIQAAHGGRVETQWQPITLQGAGLFHMAMGAIIGVAAFGRTQEKLAGVNAPGMNSGYSNSPSTGFGSPSNGFGSPSSGFNSPSNGFGSPSPGLGSPASNTFSTPNSPAPRAAYAGRPGPAAQVDPPL
jgi:hypothetical protein